MNKEEVDEYFELAQKLNRMESRRLNEHIDMHEESLIKYYIEPFENIDYQSLVKNKKECFDFVGSILNEIGAYSIMEMDKCGIKRNDLDFFLRKSLELVLQKDTNSLTFHRLKIYVLLKVMFEKRMIKADWVINNFYNIYCSGVIEKAMFYNRPIIKYKELISYFPELNNQETIDNCKLIVSTEDINYMNMIFEGV